LLCHQISEYIYRGDMVSRPSHKDNSVRDGAPSSGTTCSLELSLLSPAGIWFKTPLPVRGTNTSNTQHGFRGRECGGRQQPEDCGIPTKPAGGLLSNIGKVAPTHGRIGVLYRTAIKGFNVSPWAPKIHPVTGSSEGCYLKLTAGVEPTPRGHRKGQQDNVVQQPLSWGEHVTPSHRHHLLVSFWLWEPGHCLRWLA